MDSTIKLPAHPRILIIALRRLGDVLLTTPLIRSIRRAWPDATIHVLVFADTAGIVEGNPDIDRILTMPSRRSAAQSCAVASSILRGYDLSVSTQTGDRPTVFALLAASCAVAPVEDRFSGRLKKALLARTIASDARVHRIEALLRLADVLGIARVAEVVVPRGALPQSAPSGPLAIIHAAPMFTYKQWTMEGWRCIAAALSARGLAVVATGGPGEAERAYLDRVWNGTNVLRLDGRCDWGQLSALLAGAQVYLGPDTSVTHLAAAAGCPTVALYGPTDPSRWGPWPIGGLPEAWEAATSVQNRGNVWIVQHALPCTPCQLEGCERRLTSESACLQQLAPAQVISAIEQALASRPPQ